jgi:hypothetical protein
MVERTADGRIRTTEWEDIQYKHGNKVGQYETREMEILAQRIVASNPNLQLQAYDPVAEKVQDKRDRGGYDGPDPTDPDSAGAGEACDDDDDDVLAAYRQRRLAELQRQEQTHVFGAVKAISGSDYVREITEASSSCWVVGVMMADGHADCDLLLNVLAKVAQRNRDVKFVSLVAKQAVPNFPDKHLPCVLLYHKGDMKAQLTGPEHWMEGKNKNITVSSVERKLQGHRVIAREEYGEEDVDGDATDRERVMLKTGDALRLRR